VSGQLEEWLWDDGNLWKAADHGYSPRKVDEVSSNKPKFRENLKGRAATHQMVGPDSRDRLWTFCIVQVEDGLWRTVTGWPSTPQESKWFEEGEGAGHEG
jgi:hypothetical protein